MNFRRGSFRLWIVAATGWLVLDGWALNLPCTFGSYSAPWCYGWERYPLTAGSYFRTYLELLGVPLLALIIGTALFWAISGFVGRQRSN
jgi:hypothetical protein